MGDVEQNNPIEQLQEQVASVDLVVVKKKYPLIFVGSTQFFLKKTTTANAQPHRVL